MMIRCSYYNNKHTRCKRMYTAKNRFCWQHDVAVKQVGGNIDQYKLYYNRLISYFLGLREKLHIVNAIQFPITLENQKLDIIEQFNLHTKYVKLLPDNAFHFVHNSNLHHIFGPVLQIPLLWDCYLHEQNISAHMEGSVGIHSIMCLKTLDGIFENDFIIEEQLPDSLEKDNDTYFLTLSDKKVTVSRDIMELMCAIHDIGKILSIDIKQKLSWESFEHNHGHQQNNSKTDYMISRLSPNRRASVNCQPNKRLIFNNKICEISQVSSCCDGHHHMNGAAGHDISGSDYLKELINSYGSNKQREILLGLAENVLKHMASHDLLAVIMQGHRQLPINKCFLSKYQKEEIHKKPESFKSIQKRHEMFANLDRNTDIGDGIQFNWSLAQILLTICDQSGRIDYSEYM